MRCEETLQAGPEPIIRKKTSFGLVWYSEKLSSEVEESMYCAPREFSNGFDTSDSFRNRENLSRIYFDH